MCSVQCMHGLNFPLVPKEGELRLSKNKIAQIGRGEGEQKGEENGRV